MCTVGFILAKNFEPAIRIAVFGTIGVVVLAIVVAITLLVVLMLFVIIRSVVSILVGHRECQETLDKTKKVQLILCSQTGDYD